MDAIKAVYNEISWHVSKDSKQIHEINLKHYMQTFNCAGTFNIDANVWEILKGVL